MPVLKLSALYATARRSSVAKGGATGAIITPSILSFDRRPMVGNGGVMFRKSDGFRWVVRNIW